MNSEQSSSVVFDRITMSFSDIAVVGLLLRAHLLSTCTSCEDTEKGSPFLTSIAEAGEFRSASFIATLHRLELDDVGAAGAGFARFIGMVIAYSNTQMALLSACQLPYGDVSEVGRSKDELWIGQLEFNAGNINIGSLSFDDVEVSIPVEKVIAYIAANYQLTMAAEDLLELAQKLNPSSQVIQEVMHYVRRAVTRGIRAISEQWGIPPPTHAHCLPPLQVLCEKLRAVIFQQHRITTQVLP